MQLDPEDQTDDEKAVCYTRRRRGRLQPKRAENEFLSVIGQGPTFPEDVPGAVKEDVAHPSVVWNSEAEVFPAQGFEITVTEDAIEDTEGGFQVRVPLVTRGPHDRMAAQDGFERGLVVHITETLVLDGYMGESLGTEVSVVPECRFQYEVPRRVMEAFE